MDAIPTTLLLTGDERAFVESCLARRRELLALADVAPHGQVLARCEAAAVEMARQHAHQLLTAAVAGRVAEAEKKGARPAPVSAGGGSAAGGRTRAPF